MRCRGAKKGYYCIEGERVMGAIINSQNNNKMTELEQTKKSLEMQLKDLAKTVEKQKEQIALAGHDALTGLRNRQGVSEQIDSSLSLEKEGTFFIMDMDNFKEVNDTYGHGKGDSVLVRFADALKNISGPDDIVARIGGDEFILYSPGHMPMASIKNKAAKIVRYVEKNIATPDLMVRVTVSMGISLAPANGNDFDTLYSHGDKALYSVKSEGKNSFRFYDDVIRNRSKENGRKENLFEITSKMKEKKLEGSFFIEFDSFEKIYRFLERDIPRSDRMVQQVLLTMDEPLSEEFDECSLSQQMEVLQHCVVSTLRRGDVATKYSNCQIMILLMDTNQNNAFIVTERILQKLKKQLQNNDKHIVYEIQQLIPEEEFD